MTKFLELKMDGELVAEMPIIVHNQEKAWKTFMTVFGLVSEKVLAEFFETIRIACDPELEAQMGEKAGIKVDLATKTKPTIYIPQPNGKEPAKLPGQ